MRVTSKGQVTIPAEIRKEAGLLPGTEVEFHIDREVVTIVKAGDERIASPANRLVAHLKGRGDVKLSTDEIMALTRGD